MYRSDAVLEIIQSYVCCSAPFSSFYTMIKAETAYEYDGF